MTAVEGHPFFDFGDGVVHELDRTRAMSALVGGAEIEVVTRGAEMRERGLHVRLRGGELAGHETGEKNEREKNDAEERTAHWGKSSFCNLD